MDYLNHQAHSKTVLKVLNSALVLFVDKGFFNTSIPDLVKHSGVSTGSIYHGFKDKQAIAETLMTTLLMQIESEQQEILDRHTTCWERYYALSKWMIATAEQHPHVMQFVLTARHKEFMPELKPVCSSQPFMTLRNVIQQGMEEGVIRQMDLMVAAASSYGGVLRLIQLGLDGMLEKPLNSYLDEITQACWKSIAVDSNKEN
ncbi:TetR/AcrR family transcriptional regulator [Thiomicrorhabdus sp. ZW0627]|uniref:TetR/AcrR family transcriptional regulator n=1 Tax=Thiomicrorhabdus sp. ZW0627 TaxID=3039774 RepID=UPI00243713A1|nr:TetR/AcrR family transcriptional regulator [Thiomicrorhabdus sp. ZW0627]MDG6773410.1 TetR/AcrR family transcriptional regulator [Thiomicrorhabdus sp. ZW0627]